MRRIRIQISTYTVGTNERGYPSAEGTWEILDVNDEDTKYGVNRLNAIIDSTLKAFGQEIEWVGAK